MVRGPSSRRLKAPWRLQLASLLEPDGSSTEPRHHRPRAVSRSSAELGEEGSSPSAEKVTAELTHLVLDPRRRVAERDVRSEIERYRRGDEEVLMINCERRIAWVEMAEGRERHYCLAKGANRGAGRGRAATRSSPASRTPPSGSAAGGRAPTSRACRTGQSARQTIAGSCAPPATFPRGACDAASWRTSSAPTSADKINAKACSKHGFQQRRREFRMKTL